MTSFLTSWGHFDISFHQTFRRQCIREVPNRTFLDKKKCSYFSVKLIKQNIFKLTCNCWKKSRQEKEFVMVVQFELKISSLRIAVQHHSASLVMPNSYPRDEIFNPNLTTIEDSYILCLKLPLTPYSVWAHSKSSVGDCADLQAQLSLHCLPVW